MAGDHNAVATLARSGLDVFAHNIETVERLQPFVRDKRANYQQSLGVLAAAKRSARDGQRLYTKSSIMCARVLCCGDLGRTPHKRKRMHASRRGVARPPMVIKEGRAMAVAIFCRWAAGHSHGAYIAALVALPMAPLPQDGPQDG